MANHPVQVILLTVFHLCLCFSVCNPTGKGQYYNYQQNPGRTYHSSHNNNPFLNPSSQVYNNNQPRYTPTYPTYQESTNYAPPVQTNYRNSYQTYEKPTTLPPGPFVPAPPGMRPYCAKEGDTYCEHVDYYPAQLIVKLLEAAGMNFQSLLINEGEFYAPRAPSVDYNYSYNYTELYYTNQQQYGYGKRKKRQSFEDEGLCPVNTEFISAQAALNRDGNWKYVVNVGMNNQFTQQVRVQKCRNANQPCQGFCTPPSRSTNRCEQQFVLKRLISLDPSGTRLVNDVFLFPDCCLCKFRLL